MYRNKFSVVIPTLQRAKEFEPLVSMCSEHPLVAEIIIINNADFEVPFTYPKMRILEQESNIFVNPAWNLGVTEARSEWVAILNDDIEFDEDLFQIAARQLRRGVIGIVGVDGYFMNRPSGSKPRVRIATYEHVAKGYGMAMFMRRDDYVPVPASLLIWGGDDWQFQNQHRPNVVVSGVRFETEVSVTSGSQEFQALRAAEYEEAMRLLGPIRGQRWWHRPTQALAMFRSWRGRLAS